jgi:hypothetical protein
MVATGAHLDDHALPGLPMRTWVHSVPKRLRRFLERDADLQGAARHLFLRAHWPGRDPTANLGAVAFFHRFGSSLKAHLRFHCAVFDVVV